MIYENNKTKSISFPLGGIGSGCIGLRGNGELYDFEIFNRPNKNSRNGYTHFAIKAETKNGTITKVLHGDTSERLSGELQSFGFGPAENNLAGFPHFKSVSFNGRFPIADLTFEGDDFPAKIKLTAFNPLIPHDDLNSSIPAAFFLWEIENMSDEDVEFSLAFTFCNVNEKCDNVAFSKNGAHGIFYGVDKDGKKPDEIGYQDFTVVTDAEDHSTQECWYRGPWKDNITAFWHDFTTQKRLQNRKYEATAPSDHGTVASYFTVPAGEKKQTRFIVSWNVPNRYNYWSPYKDENGNDVTWKNYYATVFDSSRESAIYSLKNFDSLYAKTRAFSDALQGSTLPSFVIDAISSNLSVLKSPTVLRLEDGSVWAWEGVSSNTGSCEGSCQHVWNYAYALPFLFPKLERSLREVTMKYALKDNGRSYFRVALPIGREPDPYHQCLDGQMGEVIKCYREWKISGDNNWLRDHWTQISSMLEFAWSEENGHRWDFDCDGVLEGRQHHTLDLELFGPSSWLQGFYLLALYCGAKMADFMGDEEKAAKYRKLYESGRKWTNENLFNGEYFFHKIDLKDQTPIHTFGEWTYWNGEQGEMKYQIGDGCEIDQMLADWHASIIGEAPIFDKEKKDIALDSLYRYNFKKSMRDVTNMWRLFSVNDEAGTVICTYPEGAKKAVIPITYCEETMTGFEYSLAGLMIAEGHIEKGEELIRAIRDRYDGEKRNPWNEIECGSNYARSMASFALLPIYSGFSFDMREKHIGFSPVVKGDSQFAWSICNSWGNICFGDQKITLEVLGDAFTLSSFGLPEGKEPVTISCDGKEIDFKLECCNVVFDTVNIEKTLEIITK